MYDNFFPRIFKFIKRALSIHGNPQRAVRSNILQEVSNFFNILYFGSSHPFILFLSTKFTALYI